MRAVIPTRSIFSSKSIFSNDWLSILKALNTQSHHFYKIAEGKLRKLDKYVGWQMLNLQIVSGIFRVKTRNLFLTNTNVTPVEGKVDNRLKIVR